MYTATSIDVFIAAYTGAMGSFNNAKVPNSDDPTHYNRVSRAALAYAEEFDTIFAVALPNELQLSDIESISGEVNPYPGNDSSSFDPASYRSTVNAVIAMMSENSSIVAANVTNPIPVPTPVSQTVLTIATVLGATDSLRAITPTSAISAIVEGCNTAADGGGGLFFWNPSSAATDNIGTIVNPTAHVGNGRWIRIFSGEWIDVRWFGAKGDYEQYTTGQNATAASNLVPWRAFASVDGATYIGKVIQIAGAGVAGDDYVGTITAYNSITHNWTVSPTPSTSVVNAANIYATDNTVALTAAATFANLLTNLFYSTGTDLRSAQLYFVNGSFYLTGPIQDVICGIRMVNATVLLDASTGVLFDIVPPAFISGRYDFVGCNFRQMRSVIRDWDATFDGSQVNLTFTSCRFQNVDYAVMNAANGNMFLEFANCEFENARPFKGFCAILGITEATATSMFADNGTNFDLGTQGDWTDGWILIGGVEDGVMCPSGGGAQINIVGCGLSPYVSSITGAVDGQAWIIANRLILLSIANGRFGGENAGCPLLRLGEETNPADGSADASTISLSNGTTALSTNLPIIVFDDAVPLHFAVTPDCEIGNFGEQGFAPTFTQTAFDKLSKRTTNWVQTALNRVGTVGTVNNATVTEYPPSCKPSTPLLDLSRLWGERERTCVPNQNWDASGTVADASSASPNTGGAGNVLPPPYALASTRYFSVDGNPAVGALYKYFPPSLAAGWYTAIVCYRTVGIGLNTQTIQFFNGGAAGISQQPVALESTEGQVTTLGYSFYYDGSGGATDHVLAYNINIPTGGNGVAYVEIAAASLVTGKWGGNYLPKGGTSTPQFILEGAVGYDPPSIAPGGTVTTTVSVPLSQLGIDMVIPTFSLDLQGIMMTAYVSANGTVTVVLFNPTLGAIDLGNGVLRVGCIRIN